MKIMKGVNYVTNDQGEKTALIIDLEIIKTQKSGIGLEEFLEDLDDMIAAEVSKGEQGRPYSDVRKEILEQKGK